MHPELSARPAPVRDPAFDTVTLTQVSRLVDDFYTAIRNDERLGPVFNAVIKDNWPAHLDRMKGFWRSVMLKTDEYDGRPVPAHMAIPDLHEDDFRLWLTLFEKTARTIFEPAAAAQVTLSARRIARSLWFSRFATPFSKVPDWLA